MDHKTKFLFTIDTEFSLGGFFQNSSNKPVPADKIIYCKKDGKEYGINLIMDILDKYNFKGVFFVETESRFYFGEKIILDILKNIQKRGHEVQLHIHPTYRSFIKGNKIPDDMRKYSFEEQKIFIKEALKFLEKNNINNVIAYRSGGFYSNLETVKAAKYNGIQYISNYNISFPNCDYINSFPDKNDIFKIEELYELPVTCFKEPPFRKPFNSFQLEAASATEIKNALNFYHNKKLNIATYILHSFEFVKPSDYRYSTIIPQKYRINRFDNICQFLHENRDRFEVTTFYDLRTADLKIDNNFDSKPAYYKSGLFSTGFRYLENRFAN